MVVTLICHTISTSHRIAYRSHRTANTISAKTHMSSPTNRIGVASLPLVATSPCCFHVDMPKLSRRYGKVKTLVKFPSVVNAVACAADSQRSQRKVDVPDDRRIELHIGIEAMAMLFVDGEPGLSVPHSVRKPDPRIGPKAGLIELAAKAAPAPTMPGQDAARHRHQELFQHSLVPTQEYSAPHHGIIAPSGPNWTETVSSTAGTSRIRSSSKSKFRVSIEHRHANRPPTTFRR